jgi:hypothetical protein
MALMWWVISSAGTQIEVGRVFDDAAEAFGGGARSRKAECGGAALDVMGGAKQLFAVVGR